MSGCAGCLFRAQAPAAPAYHRWSVPSRSPQQASTGQRPSIPKPQVCPLCLHDRVCRGPDKCTEPVKPILPSGLPKRTTALQHAHESCCRRDGRVCKPRGG